MDRRRTIGGAFGVGAALALAAAAAPPAGAQAPAPPDRSNGTVLHIGDSFLEGGLMQALKPKFVADKTHYVSMAKSSSYLGEWSVSQELNQAYFSHRPVLFLITLGANETKAPPKSRVASVKRLIKSLRGTPCVWVGFPIWKDEPTGLNEMIKRESAPCRYFDSDAIADKIPRNKDKIHPTKAGSALWAELFYTWLKAQRDEKGEGYWALKPAAPGEHGDGPSSVGKAPAGDHRP